LRVFFGLFFGLVVFAQQAHQQPQQRRDLVLLAEQPGLDAVLQRAALAGELVEEGL